MTEQLPLLLTSEHCKDAVYIVTGANTGIGLEVSRYLIQLGSAKVILAVRNTSAGATALQDIEKTTSITGVGEVWELDLMSFDSVKKFATKAKQELGRLDAVIQNAGVGFDTWSMVEGHEASVTVNVISTSLLSVLLLPKLKQTATELNVLTHMVIVGSSYAFQYEAEVDGLKETGVYGLDVESTANMEARYGVTKMVGMFAAFELARLLENSGTDMVIINAVCPGLVKTSLGRNLKPSMQTWLGEAYKQYGRVPEEGARAVLFAASTGRDGHGKYLSDCKVKQEDVPVWMTDSEGFELQKKIWHDVVEILDNVAPGAVKEAL